ncbi:SET domain protein [Beauveria brongniartii RCEF 3172]|uniref:SET domain protein n=1 Tax=Beauveria brongniartii RCEF 3172 TaxID=1081107 RepID=A0A167JBR2_9HYPO|nr:SET domain protein [Beauveria brongniartii RCEF 3172]
MTSSTKIDALIAWATSHGAVLHPSVRVSHDAATGLSFRAVQPIPGDFSAAIVHLPAALSLSYLDAVRPSSSPPDRGTSSPPPTARPRPAAARGSSSWTLLPPFWEDDDDAELLDGTNVEVSLARIRADLRRDLAAIAAALPDADAKDETNKRLVEQFRPELYRWAYAIFSSRSFRPSLVLSDEQARLLPPGVAIDDFSVLLPLFDIGNHDMTVPVRWQRDGNGCALLTGRAHQPGEQVFNNYGLKTNAELLLGYGFMIAPTDALHNDYIHVRKRRSGADADDAPASEEYLISARPLCDASSVLARDKLPAGLDADSINPAFQHVQPDMAWDIFTSLAGGDAYKRLIPVQNTEADAEAADHERRRLLLTGKVEGACLPLFAQTAAVIQNKVLQELERLLETDVEVDGADKERLTPCQRLALDYRDRCRAGLESTLEMMNTDETLAAAMEAMDKDE